MAQFRRLKTVGVVIAVFLVVAVIVGYVAIHVIQSSKLLKRFIPEALVYLEKNFQVKASVGEINVRLLHGVAVAGLTLSYDQPGVKANIKTGSVEIRYSLLSLLSRNFVIGDVVLNDVGGEVVLDATKMKPAEKRPPFRIEDVYRQLQALPVGVTIRNIRATLTGLKVHYADAKTNAEFNLGGVDFRGSFGIARNRISFEKSLTAEDSANQLLITLKKALPKQVVVVKLKPVFRSQLNVAVGFAEKDGRVTFVPTVERCENRLALNELSFDDAGTKQHVDVKSFSIDTRVKSLLGTIGLGGELKIESLRSPLLKSDVTLGDSFDVTVSLPSRTAEFKTVLDVNSDKLLDAELILQDRPEKLLVSFKRGVSISENHAKIVGLGALLKKLGGNVRVEIDTNGEIYHGFKSLVGVLTGTDKIGTLKAAFQTQVRLPQIAFEKVSFSGGTVAINNSLAWDGKTVSEASVQSSGRFDYLRTGFETLAPLRLFEAGGGFEFEASYATKTGVQLKKAEFFNAPKNLLVAATGGGLVDSLTVAGQVRVGFGKPAAPGGGTQKVKAEGYLRFPWRLIRSSKARFVFKGDVDFDRISVDAGKFQVKNIKGTVPIEEDLVWGGGASLHFARLIERNPFERVDYSSIRNYLTDFPINFRIDRLLAMDRSVGPLMSNIQIKQNMILINHYDLSLFDGKVAGSFYFDANHSEVGLLSRLTGLNPVRLLEKAAAKEKKSGILGGRAAVLYRIRRSMLEGRVDITDIGGQQLITLINVIDPTFQNGNLNKARFALRVAYPKYVGLRFSQGLLDMDLDFGGVNLSIPVRGVPLAPILNMTIQQLTEKKLKRG